MESPQEAVPSRGIMRVGEELFKVFHDQFFKALKSKFFVNLDVLRVEGWINKETEELPFFKRKNPRDFIKLTVHMMTKSQGMPAIITRFSYLARRVQLEAAQRWARLYIRRRSKKRALAFCMGMHTRLGADSPVRCFMHPDVVRCMLSGNGILK